MSFQKTLLIIACSVFLIAACVPSTDVSQMRAPSTEPQMPTENRSTVAPPRNENGCYRPYSETSLWNVPIDWSKAKVHPNSASMLEAFFKSDAWISSDTSQYAANLYFVTNKTPLIPVTLEPGRSFRNAMDDIDIQFSEQGATAWMPLPPDAQPAAGTDGELAVINLDTGDEWGLVNGKINDLGQWSAGGVYRYHLQNSGIPPKGFAHRGAGIGSFAGLVRPCEIERGYIGHAVTLAYNSPCAPKVCQANNWPAVIPPFTKTDGIGKAQFDIPEGARLVIRPEITREDIIQACSGVEGCIVWAQNMQEYGGFVVDNSGRPKTYAEGDATANWDKNVWFDGMLRDIPPAWYVVIDWNYPSTTVP
jgi:hypothetical protein